MKEFSFGAEVGRPKPYELGVIQDVWRGHTGRWFLTGEDTFFIPEAQADAMAREFLFLPAKATPKMPVPDEEDLKTLYEHMDRKVEKGPFSPALEEEEN